MTASTQLDKYIDSFGKRLKHICLARGSAILSLAILVVCIIAAYFAINTGFSSGTVIAGRLILLTLAGAIVYLLMVKPLRRLNKEAADDIERRTPAFSGRVLTYIGMRNSNNPFRELLAEDTLKIGNEYPVDRQIRKNEFTIPGFIAGACLATLLVLIIAGPGLLNYSLRHLLAGWAYSGFLPPQNIEVTPGDELVKLGGNVRVNAVMSGFEPEQATLHVKMGDKDWQEVQMVNRMDAFEFTFFSVREPLEYYVSTTGIRSPSYNIGVVELPNVQNLKLTYNYPEWTRRDPETVEFGGDIRTVEGTRVDLEVITDKVLPAGLLILNSDKKDLQIEGESARTSFDISEDGQYYIAAQVGNERVRLTDDYFIKIIEDGKPDIKLVRPGRDWNASNIEEVTARIEVKDDYALESLELRYSVNGGEWQSVPLDFEEHDLTTIDHIFYLEDMPSVTGQEDSPLVPGDMIAYYAQASDRLNTTQTDMFFIQVQPFDRRFTQSQQMGGGGGGQNPQQEISQRQKEIIISTWNLIREQADQGKQEIDELAVQDNATLLSGLQETLAEQAKTLADRTRARQLTTVDQQISNFVEHMEKAVEAMHPAAERLAATELEAAIQPEQEALQHLLRAEAMFNDIQVSFNRGRGGGGGQAGRDLADMFELEMDLEKNQYETGSSAQRQSASEGADETMQKLEELARRQEQLANNFRRQQQLTPAQRWQQEMLQREAEELKRQLEEMQRQQAANRQSRGQQGQSAQSEGQQSSQSGSEGSESELNRRLSSAIRAMNEASEAMRNNGDREQLQRATDEARRQLEQARNQVARDQQQSMQESFQDMADRAADLHREQTRIEDTLQDAVRTALRNREEDEDVIYSPLSYDEEQQLAERKRNMLQELQTLRQDMQANARNFEQESPDAARELERANRELRESEIDTRLTIGASYIEQGAALYIASSEGVITSALRNLERNLQRAEALAGGTDVEDVDDLERALAQTRSLRRQLQQLTSGNTRQRQEGPQQQGNQSGEQQGNNNGQENQQGGNTAQRGGRFGPNSWGGGWDGWNRPNGIVPPEQREQINRDIFNTAGIVNPVIPELRDQGMTDEEIDEVYRLLRDLTYSPMDEQKNEMIMQQELTKRLALLEQLELYLERGTDKAQIGSIRSSVSERVPAEYKEAVAEYYRRLSKE